MARIPYADYQNSTEEIKKAWDEQVRHNGRVTNMKKTLLHSLPAYLAYQEWYPLADEIKPFIGERGVEIFSFAVSTGSNCVLCTTFFRKLLIERGENPEKLVLSEREQLLADFGAQAGRDSTGVDKKLFSRLKAEFTDKEIVQLTAFAGIMAATNIFNNVLEIDLDDYLENFRK